MANDITSINSARSQQAASRAAERVRDEATNSSSESTQSESSDDKVSLTSTASRLKDIERQMGSEAPVNQSRVSEVREAIARGEYSVDADRIADKMLDFESSIRG